VSDPRPRGGDAPRPVRILRVGEGESHLIRFLAGYAGCIIHYYNGAYVPCLGVVDCDPRIHRCRELWRGWAPAQTWEELSNLWWPVVLEITEALEEVLRGRQLRGEAWALTRPTVKKKGSPILGVFVDKLEGDKLPRPFDILPILQRAYHMPGIQLGIKNPTPPKLILGPSDLPPPELWKEAMEETSKPQEQMSSAEFRERLKKIGINLGENGKHNGQQRKAGESNG
jgi:hypothetical protein